ncbi:MAG: hypothetical protein K2Q24_01955 [Chitinophagaceae bacterium]|nr:hypothetical protein [Chitinophagaceae bacterium]
MSATIALIKKIQSRFASRPATSNIDSHQLLIRPGAHAQMAQTLIRETKQALSFEYTPWVMYKSANINGKYVNVSQFVRKSAPEFSISNSDSAITIYFFGGSTLFGVHAADNETIPSYFAALCKEKGVQKNIRVVNYGVPTYFSYQELMLFFQLLQQNKTPKLAVFFDGLNDFLSINEASQKHPMLNHYFQTIFNAATPVNHAEELEYSFQYSFRLPSKDSITIMSRQLASNYLKTQEQIRTIAKAYNVQTCFFLQPVPFYDYAGLEKDPVCDKNNRPQFQLIYPELEKKSTTISGFYFLGNLLKEETGYPFADALHYSPSFSKKIAAAMIEQMLPMLQQL